MAILGPHVAAPAASTGNNTHNAVSVGDSGSGFDVSVTVEAVGATPTCTFALQGSQDNTVWNTISVLPMNTTTLNTPVVSVTLTAVGSTQLFSVPGQFYKFLRLVSSANTNVTYHADLYFQKRP